MKKFTFGKNISHVGKIFFSLVLTLALLLSTVVFSSADGETAADFGGYATKYTHVYSPMDLITAANTSPKFVGYDSTTKDYGSSVWKFDAIENDVKHTMITTNKFSVNETSPNKGYIQLSNTGASLKAVYKFYASTLAYENTAQEYMHRTIQYESTKGEHMAFGFTAPVSGTYEIAAPIQKVSGTTLVNFGVTKTDALGSETELQALAELVDQDRFCDLIVDLAAGETVWLNARFAGVVTLDIGIPQAILLNNAIVETETAKTYKFRAIDYLENTNTNDITYDGNSTTSNTKAAWETGYISDTVQAKNVAGFTGKIFKFDNITMPLLASDEGTEVDASVLNAMKRYEILSAGKAYVGLPLREIKEGGALASSSGVGALWPVSGKLFENPGTIHLGGTDANIAGTNTAVFNGYPDTGKNLSTSITSSAHYYRFTAPVSGSATVNLNSDNAEDATNPFNGTTKLIVLQGNTIKRVLDDLSQPTFEIENLEKGEQITLIYYGYKAASEQVNIGSPLVEISVSKPVYATVTYDLDGGTIEGETKVQVELVPTTNEEGGTDYIGTITPPRATKKNAIHKAWYIGEEGKTLGKEFTITGDVTVKAVYNYLGDYTGDRVLDEKDIAEYKLVLLGLVEPYDLAFSEPNANGDKDEEGNDIIDICDLVCAYEFLQEQNQSFS